MIEKGNALVISPAQNGFVLESSQDFMAGDGDMVNKLVFSSITEVSKFMIDHFNSGEEDEEETHG